MFGIEPKKTNSIKPTRIELLGRGLLNLLGAVFGSGWIYFAKQHGDRIPAFFIGFAIIIIVVCLVKGSYHLFKAFSQEDVTSHDVSQANDIDSSGLSDNFQYSLTKSRNPASLPKESSYKNSSEQAHRKFIYCSGCGAKNDISSQSCQLCGNSLK